MRTRCTATSLALVLALAAIGGSTASPSLIPKAKHRRSADDIQDRRTKNDAKRARRAARAR